MVVRIRLARHGQIHTPFYRIVAADSRRAPAKKFIEMLGTYNPTPSNHGTKEVRLNTERVKHWLAVGAQPSDTVNKILAKFELVPPRPVRQSNLNSTYRPQKDPDSPPVPPRFGPRDFWTRDFNYPISSDNPKDHVPYNVPLYPKTPSPAWFAKYIQKDAEIEVQDAMDESDWDEVYERAEGWHRLHHEGEEGGDFEDQSDGEPVRADDN